MPRTDTRVTHIGAFPRTTVINHDIEIDYTDGVVTFIRPRVHVFGRSGSQNPERAVKDHAHNLAKQLIEVGAVEPQRLGFCKLNAEGNKLITKFWAREADAGGTPSYEDTWEPAPSSAADPGPPGQMAPADRLQ